MYKDSRGYLIFPIKNETYMNNNENKSKDCTYSVNKKYVFRGLHINTFGKLITCITGHFIDIMVNMETLDVKYYDIKPGNQIYCPGNYAHGFISLEENSVLSYHCEGYFGSEEGGLLNYKDPILNIKLPHYINDSDIIINEKDQHAPFLSFDYFLLGANGYIGSHILEELKKQNKKVYCLKNRMEDIKGIKQLLQFYKPSYFIHAAGLTGVPNTSWCNTHQKETLITNVIEQVNILNLCDSLNIHCTLIGSGMIFKAENHDVTNIKYSISNGDLCDNNNYYSKCRILLEEQIKPFKNCLFLRINFPISKEISNPKNLIYKLLYKYNKIENIELSITNLNSLLPILPIMIENKECGIFNFVNKNKISLVDLYNFASIHFDVENSKEIVETQKGCIELVPDKLYNYEIQDIYKSLGKII